MSAKRRLAVWAVIGVIMLALAAALVPLVVGERSEIVVDGSREPLEARPAPEPRVIAISADGLRGDVIAELGAKELPNLHRLIDEGASTDNARSMFAESKTLPNHTSMMTGSPIVGPRSHGVTFNSDDGQTVHDVAGRYVASVFDVAHDRGKSTALFAGKEKFDFLARSWDEAHGAPDVIGADDGTAKIDHYQRADGSDTTTSVVDSLTKNPYDLTFVHFRDADEAGHRDGWDSAAYEDAVRDVDGYLGLLLGAVEGDPGLADTTYLLLTADHGGTGDSHADMTDLRNVTIPLLVWGGDTAEGADLYEVNPGERGDPGTAIPDRGADPQPVRNGDIANLALDLIGLPPIARSTVNGEAELRIAGPTD